MKLGLGLYKHMLTKENLAFARQCGATHIVVHLVDYFNEGDNNSKDNQPTGGSEGWGVAGDSNELWSEEEFSAIKTMIEAAGLEWVAIENFDPAHWHDILLDGPKKQMQLENIKTLIQRIGRAGVPIMGYNFSIAGVGGRIMGPFARGGAVSVKVDGGDETPISNGMVWNMTYDSSAPEDVLPAISHETLWQRVDSFLNEILPTAEQAGVVLAAHPDDPPLPVLRGQPRLVYQPDMYQRLLNINPSPSNQLEFCIGTLAEMSEGNIYEVVDHYSQQNRVAYIHLRNVRGKVPHYHETFIDDGDVDMIKIIKILKQNHYEGVLIPDHTPQMSCEAPWHSGMAHALGYLKGLIATT